jgi:hypothetical protein
MGASARPSAASRFFRSSYFSNTICCRNEKERQDYPQKLDSNFIEHEIPLSILFINRIL